MKRVLNLMKKAAKVYFNLAAQDYAWRYTGNVFISNE
jgi:hypothetical protein|nr:MAG TPA: hypothetical protein [Bacteriophage sp.]